MSFFHRPESIFAPPSPLYIIFYHPLYSFFNLLHQTLLGLRGPPYRPPRHRIPIRVTCISDTHTKIPREALPPGDLLIHAGDLTNLGTLSQIQQHVDWLKTLAKPWPGSNDGFRYIVVVAGNHDSYFDPRSRSAYDKRMEERSRGARGKINWGEGQRKIIYLQHEKVELLFPGDRKLNVYGAPQIPACGGKEFAFQYPRGTDAWTSTVPDDIDVLVTHNPPKWHCDVPENGGLGDEFELRECWRTKPTLHVCGHVHSGHGRETLWWDDGQKGIELLRGKVFGANGVSHDQKETLIGAITEFFSFPIWAIGLAMLWADIKGVLWNRLWGGARNGGLLINAALTYQTSDELWHDPQTTVL